MAKTNRIIYPTPKYVQEFHDALISLRGSRGWVSKGMVEGCIEWVKTDVYHFIPFPSLLSKISALMYAYINFHPFTDGNKRTALMTTAFFCFINGHELTITDDAPEFTKDVAKRTATLQIMTQPQRFTIFQIGLGRESKLTLDCVSPFT